MLLSMTGYSERSFRHDIWDVSMTLQSLNSRFVEARVKMPMMLKPYEIHIQNRLKDNLLRGKIDCVLTLNKVEDLQSKTETKLNHSLITQYMDEIRQLHPSIQPEDALALAMQLPDLVLKPQEKETNSEEVEAMYRRIEEEMEALISAHHSFRQKEGEGIINKMDIYCTILIDKLAEVETHAVERKAAVRTHLQQTIDSIDSTALDLQRFEQEVVYYIEKMDIEEECVRLRLHIDQLKETMHSQQMASGKKIGFVLQEIVREINTIGSKANYAAIQKICVDMKEIAEQMREQSLNIL